MCNQGQVIILNAFVNFVFTGYSHGSLNSLRYVLATIPKVILVGPFFYNITLGGEGGGCQFARGSGGMRRGFKGDFSQRVLKKVVFKSSDRKQNNVQELIPLFQFSTTKKLSKTLEVYSP